MTQDITYFEAGYIDNNYFVYTADAESSIATSASMSCAGGVIKHTQVTIDSAFNATMSVNPIRNEESLFVVTTSLEATPKRIRDNNIAASSAFSIAVSVSRTRYISASEDSAFTINISNSRVRNNEAAVNAAFSLTVQAQETSTTPITAQVTSTLSCTAIRAIRVLGDSLIQGQIIATTGAILQTDIYPNYAKITLAQPA
jgi:hypothetical protein